MKHDIFGYVVFANDNREVLTVEKMDALLIAHGLKKPEPHLMSEFNDRWLKEHGSFSAAQQQRKNSILVFDQA